MKNMRYLVLVAGIKNMIVKIKSSRDFLVWYSNLVGSEWLVIREDNECYWVRDYDGRINIIYKEDTH
jgi:hypothetical protein